MPFSLKISPKILTSIVKPILVFLYGKNINLRVFMNNFTNKTKCDYKVIFEIHIIVREFMCCIWYSNWVKTYKDPTWIQIHLGFFWDTSKGTVALPEDKTT